ncbi:hypothetical protein GUJ93_ZPchr0005g14790 [Zizania palustris]|uniref:Uncharacterized protein n=1 Tax=Zizania palustris TaxID=103762 RepID=A0A8J5SVE4_ZIZPA|nr:hypothetical protein GUJ93_ZPchr0005g14790 [Zizania palustris]
MSNSNGFTIRDCPRRRGPKKDPCAKVTYPEVCASNSNQLRRAEFSQLSTSSALHLRRTLFLLEVANPRTSAGVSVLWDCIGRQNGLEFLTSRSPVRGRRK